MKTILAVVLVATATIAAASSANARDGCGGGYHRGPYGHCRPNRGDDRVVVVPSIGGFYAARGGYWDGNRYWMHRDRDAEHGGWRYR
jgi:hypothetical protein